MQFIDLHRQYDQIKENVDKRIATVLEHKAFIGGPEVKEFEEMLKSYTGRKYVIGCASGTDAITLPLMAYNLKKEDAVFVPSFTFFASAESIALAGGTPVFVDSKAETFNIDPEDLEKKIKETIDEGKLNPRGIIAVDLFGLPAEFDRLTAIAEKYNLFLLEDAAQGFGGQINGKKACSFGDVSSTSFFPAKPLGCYGDGGAIFTDDEDLYKKILSLHVHGQGSDKYENIAIGLNSRLDTIQAAVLIEKLKIFDDELIKRNKVADKYTEMLNDVLETPVIPEGYYSSWAQYTLKAKSAEHREEIIEKLKKNNIPAMIYYPIPVHKSGAFSNMNKISLPSCEKLSDCVFSIPMHPYLSDDEIETICNIIKK